METTTRKQIFTNPVLEVAIEHTSNTTDPGLISIRLHNQPHDMPGEVLLAPGDIPEIIKALSQASLQTYRQEGYNIAMKENINE